MLQEIVSTREKKKKKEEKKKKQGTRNKKQETGKRKEETRNRKQEARSKKQETRKQGNKETRKQGNKETRKQGNKANKAKKANKANKANKEKKKKSKKRKKRKKGKKEKRKKGKKEKTWTLNPTGRTPLFNRLTCRLCFVNLKIHPNSLENFTFFTHVKYGQHTVVHERTPNCLTHKKIVQLFNVFPKCWAHVLDDLILQVFIFITECLKINRWISSKLKCWYQSYSKSHRAVDAGFSVFTCAGFPRWTWRTLTFTSFLLWWGILHWVPSSCVTCGIFVAMFLSQCVWRRMWSHQVSPSCIAGCSLRYDRLLSSLLIRPFFLWDKVNGVALTLLLIWHISLTLRHAVAQLSPPFLRIRTLAWEISFSTMNRDDVFDPMNLGNIPTNSITKLLGHDWIGPYDHDCAVIE